MARNVKPTVQETDRILAVNLAVPILREMFGDGWSRTALKRKIETSTPFNWVEGVHYLRGNMGRNGAGICSLNIDAIRRSWTKGA